MTDDTLIIDLVCKWEDRRAQGESVTLEELCHDCPHLLEQVRVAITKLRFADGLLALTVESRAIQDDATLPHVPGYILLDVLGRGGMGVVYKARQVSVNRVVALKMIRSGNLSGSDEKARFQVEAEAVAALKHPNVVQLHEFGVYQGLPYFTLEYMEGGSLAAKIKETSLSAPEAARLVAILARAMAAAHASGIVHRDLKPENVLLSADGNPKITDFGLAKSLSRPAPFDDDTPTVDAPNPGYWSGGEHLTRTGAIMGTPCYMAPEQARGEKHVGPAADIWALGAILYRLLTGRTPFLGATVIETIRQVIDIPPVTPRSLDHKLSRDLETICLKCLRKEPEKRYASAQALADDLQCYLDGKPILARPIGRFERSVKWVKRNPVETTFIAVILGLLFGGTALVYAKYLDAKQQEAEAKKQTGIAKENEDEAKKQEWIAKEEVSRTKRQRDNATILLAQSDFANDNASLALDRLDEIEPENRGWEWHYLKRHFEGGLFTLYEHTERLTSVAVSVDGDRIVTGSADKTARVWDGRTGQRLLVLQGHTSEVLSVAMSVQGGRIVTGSYDRTARVWDDRTGQSLLVLKGHTSDVSSVAVSADGGRIVTGSRDKTARLWDGRTGQSLLEFKGHTDRVTSVAVSADGSRILTGSLDKSARVWDGRSGQCLLVLKEHPERLTSVAMSADGGRIVTGSYDKMARVWDGRTGQFLHELRGHAEMVGCVAVSADGSRIVTGSRDKTAREWDGRTGQSLLELKGHTGDVSSVAVSADGGRIITGSGHQARVWDGRTGQSMLELKGHIGMVSSLAMSADGDRIVTGSWDNTVRVWDGRTGRRLLELMGNSFVMPSVAVSADGGRIATGLGIRAQVWDGRTGESLLELKGHTRFVTSVAVIADGERIVTGSVDQTARVWNGRTGYSLLELKGHTDTVSSVAVSADGGRIVTGSDDQTARVWDGRTGRSILELKGHTDKVNSVAISADGGCIVTGSNDQTARVWDGRTGQSLLELKGHTGTVSSVAVNADGGRIVTGSGDKTAREWDGRTGQSLLELKGHTSLVWSVAVSADGGRILTGSHDKTARVWDGRPRQSPLELNGYVGDVSNVVVSADGSRVVTFMITRDSKDIPIVWDATTGARLKDATLPLLLESTSRTPDGKYVFVPVGNRVQRVALEIDAEERLRRLWLTRPNPDWHIQRQKELAAEKNDYGVDLHRSFEQRARGIVALDFGRIVEGMVYLARAKALMPKVPVTPEFGPMPREIKTP